MEDARVQIPLDALYFGKTNQLAMVPVLKTGEPRGLVGSTPTLSAFKVVLLGEQPASKAGGVGSNPTNLARHRAGDRAARQPSDTRYEAGSTPARDAVAEPKEAAGPGCEPGLCGFNSSRRNSVRS